MTQQEALTILKTGANVFLTGEPGSGKTHAVNLYVSYLLEHDVVPTITASTGIAATHIQGVTIHSWSGIGIKRTLSPYDIEHIASTEHVARRIRKTKVLIIDEISMLDATMLDMVDAVCRAVKQNTEPFGGIQVVLVGDFFQLPPVTMRGEQTNFAFHAAVWKEMRILTCYLTEQYRQTDERLLSVLSAIRSGTFDTMHYEYLEQCQCESPNLVDRSITRLFSHNVNVDEVNELELAGLSGIEKKYEMTTSGAKVLVDTLIKGCLSPYTLALRLGAVVMCTKNNREKDFANGTLGVVVGFEHSSGFPIVQVHDGRTITIEPMDWVIEDGGKIKASITQIPLRLAWAITIHKSQGMSLDAAVMDLTQIFEYGQGYVALSRVRSLSGLYILGTNPRAFMVHPEILEKDVAFRADSHRAQAIFVDMQAPVIQKMHEDFLRAIGGSVKRVAMEGLVKKRDTYEKTKELIEEGKSIAFIAKERKLSPDTIIGHIEKLINRGAIAKEHILQFFDDTFMEEAKLIIRAFALLETTSLTPVFEYFQGKYSYDEIKLARLLFLVDKG